MARHIDGSGGWDIFTVDSTSADVGKGTSITSDISENNIYISYIVNHATPLSDHTRAPEIRSPTA